MDLLSMPIIFGGAQSIPTFILGILFLFLLITGKP